MTSTQPGSLVLAPRPARLARGPFCKQGPGRSRARTRHGPGPCARRAQVRADAQSSSSDDGAAEGGRRVELADSDGSGQRGGGCGLEGGPDARPPGPRRGRRREGRRRPARAGPAGPRAGGGAAVAGGGGNRSSTTACCSRAAPPRRYAPGGRRGGPGSARASTPPTRSSAPPPRPRRRARGGSCRSCTAARWPGWRGTGTRRRRRGSRRGRAGCSWPGPWRATRDSARPRPRAISQRTCCGLSPTPCSPPPAPPRPAAAGPCSAAARGARCGASRCPGRPTQPAGPHSRPRWRSAQQPEAAAGPLGGERSCIGARGAT